MTPNKRVYWIVGLVAILALAAAGVTLASSMTSARGADPTPAAQTCDQQDAGDAAGAGESDGGTAEDVSNTGEAQDGTASDSSQNESGDAQDKCGAADGSEQANASNIDDGKELLPQASITLDQAIAAARTAASGDVGEIDLEDYNGKLAFNVEIGDKDVKIDSSNGTVLGDGSD